MKSETMDRRVRKTRKQLKECLIMMLKTKKIQEITVRELTDAADLNRGTFYLHYKDVFDLLEKTQQELRDQFNDLLYRYEPSDLREKPFAVFYDIYQLVYENADLIEILLGENGDLNFVTHMKRLIKEKCLKDWLTLYHSGNSEVFDAFFSFIVSGCIGLIQYWLESGLKESPQQMAALTEQMITKGINVLLN